jgi:soluble lytic murein transglycosylase
MLVRFPRRALPALALVLLTLLAPAALRADGDDGIKLARSAGAAERAGRRAEARQLYLEAAEASPLLADWLIRRAALLTPDSILRRDMLRRIDLPVAMARILETEAAAREQAGDLRGALVRYDSLGRVGDVTRLRLRLARTATERSTIRRDLVTALRERPTVATLEALFASGLLLPASEALAVARAATTLRQPAREVALYPRAIQAGLAKPEDRLAYGVALAKTRRYSQAVTIFTGITSPLAVAREALWQKALAQARLGQDAAAAATLTRLLARHPDDSAVTPAALFLAGHTAQRLGDKAAARKHWTDLATRYPESDSAGRAGFLAALVLWEKGEKAEAAAEWEAVHQRDAGADGLAAGYWAGRAWDEVGDRSRAELLWQSVLARSPLSYYASVSARRLGVPGWQPLPAEDSFPMMSEVAHALQRIDLLTQAELPTEAGWERDWLLNEGDPSPERLLTAADGFRRLGQPAVAVSFARKAERLGAPKDARTYRLLYPLYYTEELERQASATGLDPLVVAALIRQESAWEARARSRAGALGLMQVMPETGRLLARGLKLTGWRTDRLHDPATNLQLGTHYLAHTLERFEGDLGRALAAYNAGPGRVVVWAAGAAASDPDLFVEKIQFAETRDYVRVVQRNIAIYRALYGPSNAAKAAREVVN